MRKAIVTSFLVAVTLVASGAGAFAQWSDRSATGAAVGATTGALLAGPPGAAFGLVIGAAVGVPRNIRRNQECWYDRAGMRHCRSY